MTVTLRAKRTEIMLMRHGISNLLHRDDSQYLGYILKLKKICNFQLIFGFRNFENFISSYSAYHQKTKNLILEGYLVGLFEIQEYFGVKSC